MSNDISTKAICLKLNSMWEPIEVSLVSDTICDLMTGVVLAMDIVYTFNKDGTPNFGEYEYVNPVCWEEWLKLPVRPWDLSIHSAHMTIRVPTVCIAKNYSKVPEKKFKGKSPSKEGLFIRDNGIDGYTGEEIAMEEASIDHIIPRSKGGADTYDNTVLTSKYINNFKGNHFNHEVGLTLVVNPHTPEPIKVSHTIRKVRHQDWKPFLKTKKS